MTVNNPPIGLRAAEAAKILGIGKTCFYALNSSGRLPRPRRLGRCTVWDRRELESWFAMGCPERSRWEIMRRVEL
jgi:predicted DNA-binding transcriptional regulator AlpA